MAVLVMNGPDAIGPIKCLLTGENFRIVSLLASSELQRPTKKPRILPGRKIDENSKTFKSQLQSVAVDGTDIIAAARDAYQKSLAKLEAKDAAAKAAAKREEERVAQLKKIRGERWLPSIAREMRSNASDFKCFTKCVTWWVPHSCLNTGII
ncbi:hypothetical protein CsSME_00003593 [Camellia sinensis var. sinensis]